MLNIDKTISNNKSGLIEYFRSRASESIADLISKNSSQSPKKLAKEVNPEITDTKDALLTTLRQKALAESWTNEEILRAVLTVTYSSYVAMIECRNDVWKYDYMSFSRRIGEIWEPFCKLCFQYPINPIEFYLPPLFADVKSKFNLEVEEYVDTLQLVDEQKQKLKTYYGNIWSYVDSGEIKLESDLHFRLGDQQYVIDFKSGFGSNEKGNTNRLLLVAAIYRNLQENYKCVLLVRAEEDQNNSYFKRLRNSGMWEAYCGAAAYQKISEYTGFDLKEWISQNINWSEDLKAETIEYLTEQGLQGYLKW